MKISVVIGLVVVAATLLGAIPANALPTPHPKYNLVGTWTFIGNGGIHTMMINSFNPVTGAFSGVGYFTGGVMTWVITGTERGETINFLLTVETGAPGLTATGSGTITSSTYMSGTGTVSDGESLSWTATKGTEVMNVSYLVLNDEAMGNKGYWAIENYIEQVQVWQDPNNVQNFYSIGTDVGTWTTFKGALSPGSGTPQTAGATGLFQGGWFSGFGASSYTPKFGFLGIYNLGGSKADVLAQKGPPTRLEVTGLYFVFTGGYTYNLGWTYHYGSQSFVYSFLTMTGTGEIIIK